MTLLAFTRKLLNLQMYCLLQPLISLRIFLTLTWWNSQKPEVLTFHFFINIGNYRPKSKPCEKKVLPVIKFFWRHELQTCIYVLDEKNANIQKLIIKDKIFKRNLTCTCNNNIIKSYYLIWHCTSLGWFYFNTDISVATCTHSIKQTGQK